MRRSRPQILAPTEGRRASLSGIRAVLFDLDNTLYDHTRASREALLEAARGIEALAGLDVELLCREFQRHNDACWQLAVRGEMDRDELRVARFRRMLAALGVRLEAEGLSDVYLARYAGRAVEVPGAREVAVRLRERMPVGVVTNGFVDLVEAKLEAIGLAGALSPVLVAERIEDMKPRRAIFRAALKALDLPAQAVLVVGDSLAVDVAGARAAGMPACWFNRDGGPPPEGASIPEVTIAELAQLPELLGLAEASPQHAPRVSASAPD